jgi:beta-mannosidase
MKQLDLCGAWTFSKEGSKPSWRGNVPGCVHTDLLAAGEIEDPFYRDNESGLQWISRENWVYERTFQMEDWSAFDRVLLRCDGLDTIATVTLNGAELGTTDNQYRTWEFNVKGVITTGRNTLRIRFESPLAYIEQRAAGKRALPGWAPPQETACRPWIRKSPCSFGWDWGPVLTSSGIWRPLEIVAFNTARITDLQVRQDHSRIKQGVVGLDIDGVAEIGPAGDAEALDAHARVYYKGSAIAAARGKWVDGRVHLHIDVRNAQLWWPAGMGEQPLYEVTLDVEQQRAHVAHASRRVGLRTLRLDRHEDAWGESFQFVINDIPFFAKGANWIPADAFVVRISRVEYARLIKAAAMANMNMLRVWGGGIYENDAFYDLCDEYGLCVWQDFMFACATYPAFDEAWMANVRIEIEQNVRRLRHHPSIALWCGNNELEQGLVGDTWSGGQMSWEDYGALFDRLIAEVVAEQDPQRDYWPSSPHTPPPGDRKNHADPARGDAHLWDVWHGRQPFEWYRTTQHRFCSEFGFQSFPEPRAVERYTAPGDRNITSPVMERHQRSGIGNAVIMHYLLDWYRMPVGFENTLWLSQIQQGMAIKYAVEHWRRNRPRCMGALYWQLNDCWPVASWASIDYEGRWKALHYMARRFYAPLLVSGVEKPEDGTVDIHAGNDLLKPFTGKLAWRVTRVDGKVVRSGTLPVMIATGTTALQTTLELADLIAQYGVRDLIVWLTMLDGEGSAVSWNVVTFCRPKHLELHQPNLKVEIRAWDDNSYAVTLSSKVPVLWLWASLTGIEAKYDDNFICLEPARPMRIRVTPVARMKLDDFREALVLRSVWDTYQDPCTAAPAPAPAPLNRVALLARRVAAEQEAKKKVGKTVRKRKTG